ncbi:MAG: CBO0543 family protein [Burkholderiales bacterium]
MDPSLIKAIDEINNSFVGVHDRIWEVWLSKVVFSWHWWLDVALSVLPWVLWLIVRRRDIQRRLLFAGLVTALLATYLDIIGMSQGWWTYYTWVLPLMPEFLPWDLAVMPVMAMLFYQYKQNWNPWIKAAIFAALGSFGAEPLFEFIGIYRRIAWEHWYSFPIYIAVYMLGYIAFSRRRSAAA